jgi:steroid delta-isomerase-like uncharacterized protein
MSVNHVRATRAAQVVSRYLDDVLVAGNLSALEELVSNEALRQRIVSLRRAFPDFAITSRLVISEGDLVAVHLTGRGTHRDLFQGVPATGRAWTAGCTAIYRVKDQQIAEAWVNWDLLAILEQIGGVRRAAIASA